MHKWLRLPAALLALTSSAMAQRAALAPGETLLEVSAEGEVEAVPDVAELSVGIASDGASARAAMEGADVVAARLIAAARGAGVPDAAMRTETASVHARYAKDKDGDDTDEIAGYRATYRLKLRMTDLARAPAAIDALVRAGATDLDRPRFSFADDAPLQRRARARAVEAASAEADDYAAALHLRVARILRVSERSAASKDGQDIVVTASRRPGVPLAPGTQTTTSHVWIDYALVAR